MSRYSIFQGEQGLKIKSDIWKIMKVKNPEKDKILDSDILEFAQDFLFNNIPDFFNYELKQDLAGDVYGHET